MAKSVNALWILQPKYKTNVLPKTIVHFIKEDETIETIAKKYNVSVEQIRSWNSLSDTSSLKPNDEIILFKDTK